MLVLPAKPLQEFSRYELNGIWISDIRAGLLRNTKFLVAAAKRNSGLEEEW